MTRQILATRSLVLNLVEVEVDMMADNTQSCGDKRKTITVLSLLLEQPGVRSDSFSQYSDC
ncbi:hypothetical protein SK128_014561 [Halocaridina rubra]|uniref:Uncharacterized protein n=1 Tax=Halocaridina rubra TaxID=373956 RepID=A0AAN9A4Y1_HALRR